MTAEATVESIIANAKAIADSTSSLAQSFSQSAQTAAGGAISVSIDPPTDPNVPRPLESEKPIDLSGFFENAYSAQVAAVEAELNTRFADYLNTYFPSYSSMTGRIETWLEDVIDNSTTGLNAAFEQAVWERSRGREIEESIRLEEEAITNLAARGFSMPNTMLLARQQEIGQKVLEKTSTHAREIAINHLQVAVEQVRFAVQQSVTLYSQVTQAALAYVQDYLRAVATGTDKARGMVDSKNALYQMAYRYYDTYIAWGNMMNSYEQIANNASMQEATLFIESAARNRQSRVEAAIGGAEAMGRVAAAALGSQNTIATLAHETTVEE